jgi:hypothetical protein
LIHFILIYDTLWKYIENSHDSLKYPWNLLFIISIFLIFQSLSILTIAINLSFIWIFFISIVVRIFCLKLSSILFLYKLLTQDVFSISFFLWYKNTILKANKFSLKVRFFTWTHLLNFSSRHEQIFLFLYTPLIPQEQNWVKIEFYQYFCTQSWSTKCFAFQSFSKA